MGGKVTIIQGRCSYIDPNGTVIPIGDGTLEFEEAPRPMAWDEMEEFFCGWLKTPTVEARPGLERRLRNCSVPWVDRRKQTVVYASGVPYVFGSPTGPSVASDVAMACAAAGVSDTQHLAGYIVRLRQEVEELRCRAK